MKRHLIIPVLGLLIAFWGCDRENLKPDPPEDMFLFGGELAESGYDLLELNDGSLLLLGSSRSWSEEEDHDIYLVKTDANGSLQWERTYPAPLDNVGHKIIPTQDGGYLIAGLSGNSQSSIFTVYMLKLDAQFEEEWTISHANDPNSFGTISRVNTVYETEDNGFLIESANYSVVDLLKTDEQGNLISRTTHNNISYNQTPQRHLIRSRTGGFLLITGDYTGTGNLYRFDGNGVQQYAQNYNLPDQYYPVNFVEEIDTNEIVIVYGDPYTNRVYQIDSLGQAISNAVSLPELTVADMELSSDGSLLLVGSVADYNYGGYGGYGPGINLQALKVNLAGDVLGAFRFEGEGTYRGNSIMETASSQIAVIGNTNGYKGSGSTELTLILTNF